jgi:hypothetical protein
LLLFLRQLRVAGSHHLQCQPGLEVPSGSHCWADRPRLSGGGMHACHEPGHCQPMKQHAPQLPSPVLCTWGPVRWLPTPARLQKLAKLAQPSLTTTNSGWSCNNCLQPAWLHSTIQRSTHVPAKAHTMHRSVPSLPDLQPQQHRKSPVHNILQQHDNKIHHNNSNASAGTKRSCQPPH